MVFELLSDELRSVLLEMGFEKPTEIQKLSFPAIQNNEDCLLIAPTGFGKTEAALLPIINRLMQIPKSTRDERGIFVLYVTPLRALNRDIYRRIIEIGEKVNVSIALRHGDTPTSERTKQSKKPPEILVTTPEMLQAIIVSKRIGRVHLKDVRVIIIDEIHSLVDNKRGIQLSLAIERLKRRIGRGHLQYIGLSATVGSPKLVAQYLAMDRDVTILNVIEDKKIDIEVLYPVSNASESNKIKKLRKIISSSEEVASRFSLLLKLLSPDSSTLLFTNTRQMAEILSWRISQFLQDKDSKEIVGFDLQHSLHHSSISRDERINAENEFRAGTLNLVVSTSSLELGIDIGLIDQVIQYMSPRRAETLLQRIGRSGHSRKRVSVGKILAISPSDSLESSVIAYLAMNKQIEQSEIYEKAYDVLLHQIVGIILDNGKQELDAIYETVVKAYPYRNLSMDELKDVLRFGVDNYFFIEEPSEDMKKLIYIARRKCYEYYYSNLSTIPDVRSYRVINIANNRYIGRLDEAFVVSIEVSVKIILKGEVWKILAIDEDDLVLRVSPQVDFEAAIPSWKGELIPISPLVAQKVRDTFTNKKLSEILPTNSDTLGIIKKFVSSQPENLLPRENILLIEDAGNYGAIHSFLGSKGNNALAILLSGLVTTRNPMAGGVNYSSDAYTILMRLGLQNISVIREILQMLEPDHVKPLLETFLKKTDLYRIHFQNVAKRVGVIKKDAKITRKAINILKSRYSGNESIISKEVLNEIFFEKIDYKAVVNLINKISLKEIEIKLVPVKSLDSPLALASDATSGERILRTEPTAAILHAVEKRINQTSVSLHCLNLKCDWSAVKKLERISDEDVVCPKCGRRYIAVGHPKSDNQRSLIRREMSGEVLDSEDKKKLKNAKKSADLVLNFGKKAIFILAGRGIGPTKAARILRMMYSSREELLEEILLQESEFTRTREFWA